MVENGTVGQFTEPGSADLISGPGRGATLLSCSRPGQLIDSLQTDNIMLIACPRSTRIPCAPLPKDYLLKQLLCLDTVLGSFVHRNWLSSTSLRNMYDMHPPRWSLQRVLTAAISLPVPALVKCRNYLVVKFWKLIRVMHLSFFAMTYN